jgi:anion transporter
MEQSTIAIIILVITMILVVVDRLPLAVTALFASLAMSITGVQPLKDAYAYFGSKTVIFVGATMIICNGLFQTGAIQKLTHTLFGKLAKRSERGLVAAFSLFTGLVTGFTTNSAIAATMVPVARSLAASSEGKVKAKHLLMPVGLMSTIGSPLSLSGSGAVALGAAMVIDAGAEMHYFQMAGIALVMIGLSTVYFATLGYDIMKKSFDFEEPEIEQSQTTSDTQIPAWKPILTTLVFLVVIAGFVTGIWDLAICSTLGVIVLWATNAVNINDSLKACNWNVIIVMAGVSSMANGLKVSGAGQVIADTIINLFGGESASVLMIMIALSLVGWFLSQFMSNTAANAIVVPMAISMATALNVNLVYLCAPIIIATSIAITTPLASPTTVIVMQGGFRFKDFVKVGLPLSVLLLLILFVMTPMFFSA